MIPKWLHFSRVVAPLWLPFSSIDLLSNVGRRLVHFWLPLVRFGISFGALWLLSVPFWRFWVPFCFPFGATSLTFGEIWRHLAPIWLPLASFGFSWLPFISFGFLFRLLASLGSLWLPVALVDFPWFPSALSLHLVSSFDFLRLVPSCGDLQLLCASL